MLCFGDVNLLFDQARKRFERLLLPVNRSRFVISNGDVICFVIVSIYANFCRFVAYVVVLFDVIDVS